MKQITKNEKMFLTRQQFLKMKISTNLVKFPDLKKKKKYLNKQMFNNWFSVCMNEGISYLCNVLMRKSIKSWF